MRNCKWRIDWRNCWMSKTGSPDRWIKQMRRVASLSTSLDVAPLTTIHGATGSAQSKRTASARTSLTTNGASTWMIQSRKQQVSIDRIILTVVRPLVTTRARTTRPSARSIPRTWTTSSQTQQRCTQSGKSRSTSASMTATCTMSRFSGLTKTCVMITCRRRRCTSTSWTNWTTSKKDWSTSCRQPCRGRMQPLIFSARRAQPWRSK